MVKKVYRLRLSLEDRDEILDKETIVFLSNLDQKSSF